MVLSLVCLYEYVPVLLNMCSYCSSSSNLTSLRYLLYCTYCFSTVERVVEKTCSWNFYLEEFLAAGSMYLYCVYIIMWSRSFSCFFFAVSPTYTFYSINSIVQKYKYLYIYLYIIFNLINYCCKTSRQSSMIQSDVCCTCGYCVSVMLQRSPVVI